MMSWAQLADGGDVDWIAGNRHCAAVSPDDEEAVTWGAREVA